MKHRAISHWFGYVTICAVLLLVATHKPKAAPVAVSTSFIPHDVTCWQTEGTEFQGYTPAHILEREILRSMEHKYGATQECGGIVQGRYVVWPAVQPWIARGQPANVGTGDYP